MAPKLGEGMLGASLSYPPSLKALQTISIEQEQKQGFLSTFLDFNGPQLFTVGLYGFALLHRDCSPIIPVSNASNCFEIA